MLWLEWRVGGRLQEMRETRSISYVQLTNSSIESSFRPFHARHCSWRALASVLVFGR